MDVSNRSVILSGAAASRMRSSGGVEGSLAASQRPAPRPGVLSATVRVAGSPFLAFFARNGVVPSTLPPCLGLRKPSSSQPLSRYAGKQGFDIKNRSPIQHVDPANLQLATLAPQQFDDRQSNRVRTTRRPRCKNSMRPIVGWRRTQQFEPLRPVELPENGQMREALNVGKPRLKLRQDLEYAIRLVLSAKPLRNLARVLVRTTHKSNRPRCKHLSMSPFPVSIRVAKRRHSLAQHASARKARVRRIESHRDGTGRLARCFLPQPRCDIQPCSRQPIAQ